MGDSQEILKKEDDDAQQVGEKNLNANKTPRRVIYFASGESMEEYSTEEEEDAVEVTYKTLLDPTKLSWGAYLRLWARRMAATAFFTCDFLGGKLATFLGLNEPKYQYAIDEYYRTQEKENESDEDGEEMPTMEEIVVQNEKQRLQMQSLEYGSIHCQDMSAFSQENTVENVNELGGGSLPDPKCTSATGK
ncbi:protein FAM177B [Hemicordylus capensis]|uniref:protein FAM177B n=1 Tax=Hemicordylus capensis TaxID=884348 RepID=UPI002303760D|nr:protein FAM177B [Hemicordylus capensis]